MRKDTNEFLLSLDVDKLILEAAWQHEHLRSDVKI